MGKYPKTIYVQKEKDTDNSTYLLAWDKVDDANDGEVAVYEFVENKKKITTSHLS